jgi:hypothetical protein
MAMPIVCLARLLGVPPKGRHAGSDIFDALQGGLEAGSSTLALSGFSTGRHVDEVIPWFQRALAFDRPICINFYPTRFIDARFLGLLLMLRKRAIARGIPFTRRPSATCMPVSFQRRGLPA